MSKKNLNIGMIGYGFMGRAHTNAYCQVSHFFDSQHKPVLKAVCARDEAKAKSFAEQWGYESIETDWRKLVARKDIDVIDICVPNNLHAEIAIEAAKNGKMILCEKPLAMDSAQGLKMVEAVEKAKVANMVWYNYRRIPAVTLAKRLIDEGKLGKIFHYRAKFLQDWTIKSDLPQGGQGLWRLDLAAAGAGVSGDLLAHCIDTAIWLNGPMSTVSCMTETFVKERMHTLTGKVEKVGIDDACIFFGKFANGSLANFESTRYARGHKAAYTFEINGENMSLGWDLHDLHRLQVFDYTDESKIRGWKSVHVTDNSPEHPYMEKWWVPGLSIGYDASFTHQVADFLTGLDTGKTASPTFRDALETQQILDAILESAKTKQWVSVAK
ncbi:MAG: Gfo/Idh/MocA family oxidoreductase [Gemmataceae bacterium]|nr:Gfo/Idh/MocA family oxidoreductase [Gemmataceae bacterium]